jgi:hypothetical protein
MARTTPFIVARFRIASSIGLIAPDENNPTLLHKPKADIALPSRVRLTSQRGWNSHGVSNAS